MTLCISPHCSNPSNPDNTLFCKACGSEILIQGRYRAIRLLGSGGFGKTYEITDQGTTKVLKTLINNSPKSVELFQREAQVLSSLNHPSIPRVESNGYFIYHPQNNQEPVHCLVMEKMEGETLKNYIKRRGGSINEEVATGWLKELLLILQEVHKHNILHRDIKPQNVILKADGKLALIDFGAVKEGTGTEVATGGNSGGKTEIANQTSGGTSIISSGYTPSEQINGQALPQSDFYALARTIIFTLTGKEPSEIPYDPYDDELKWRQYAPNVSSQLATLLDRMQATLARQRPNNAQEILDKIESFSHRETSGQEKDIKYQQDIGSETTPQSSQKKASKAPLILGLLAIPLILGTLFIVSQNQNDDPLISQNDDPITTGFPKQDCGTGAGYRVYISYSEDNLNRVKASFCGDAFLANYNGQQAIQVAAFADENQAIEFKNFMENKFGSATLAPSR